MSTKSNMSSQNANTANRVMDYNLKGKSPGMAPNQHRSGNITPTGSPRISLIGGIAASPRTAANTLANVSQQVSGLGGILAPKAGVTGGAKANASNDPTGAANNTGKKVSTDAEIREKLTGYVQVEQTVWGKLPVGTHIRYFARGDGARNARFRTGGFIVSWTKSANGKVYLKIANKLEFTNKQAGYRDFSVDTANIVEIWAKPEIVDKVKNEVAPTDIIKQLVEEVAALKTRVAALERKK